MDLVRVLLSLPFRSLLVLPKIKALLVRNKTLLRPPLKKPVSVNAPPVGGLVVWLLPLSTRSPNLASRKLLLLVLGNGTVSTLLPGLLLRKPRNLAPSRLLTTIISSILILLFKTTGKI